MCREFSRAIYSRNNVKLYFEKQGRCYRSRIALSRSRIKQIYAKYIALF